MTDWQTRHDIDQIRWVADELQRVFEANKVSNFKELMSQYYDQSVVDASLSQFSSDLDGFVTSLNNLSASLDSLEDDIWDDEDGLAKALNDLADDLNGEDGLVNQLTALQSQLDDVEESNTDLLDSLNELSGYLTAYNGTLAQFKAKLENELGSDEYAKLNQDTIELVYAIANSKSAISTSQSTITSLNTAIGDTSQITGSVVTNISNVNTSIDNVQTDLWGSNGSASNPQTNSVKANINKVKNTDIPNIQDDIESVQTDVGEVDVEVNSDLQTQIINLISMVSDLFISVGRVQSVADVTDSTIPITIDGVTTTYYVVSEDYPYDIIYSEGSDEYFRKRNVMINNVEYTVWDWVANPYTSQFKQTMLYDILSQIFVERSTPVDLLTSYTIGFNEYDATNLTVCEATFYRQLNIVTCIYHFETVTFSNQDQNHTIVSQGKIPSAFRPPTTFNQNIVGEYNDSINHGLLMVNTDGSMYIRSGKDGTSIKTMGKLTYIVED